MPPPRYGGLFTRAGSQGKTGWTLSLESGRTHRTFPASSCHEGKIAQNPEATAHLRALAGLRAELIPTDATRIVSHLFLLAFSRLGGFTRLADFCRLGALVALTVHGHDTKATDYSTLAIDGSSSF